MVPKSFDIDTAKEVVGDQRMRAVEAKARSDADSGLNDPPPKGVGSYWSQVSADMDWVVYTTAHGKRIERIKRMRETAPAKVCPKGLSRE